MKNLIKLFNTLFPYPKKKKQISLQDVYFRRYLLKISKKGNINEHNINYNIWENIEQDYINKINKE